MAWIGTRNSFHNTLTCLWIYTQRCRGVNLRRQQTWRRQGRKAASQRGSAEMDGGMKRMQQWADECGQLWKRTTDGVCIQREDIMDTRDGRVMQVCHRGRNIQRLWQKVEWSDGKWWVGGTRRASGENNKCAPTKRVPASAANDCALLENSLQVKRTDNKPTLVLQRGRRTEFGGRANMGHF